MSAHLEEALLGLVGRFLVGRDGAAAAHLHVGFEERLLAGADLHAEFDAVLLGGRGIGGDELVEPIARAPPPPLGPQIAQDGGDHGQRHEALLTVDDLEQPRIAIARLGQVAAGAVDENDRAEKVVGLLAAGPTAKPRRPENILEQLARFRCGPRVRPLVTGHRKVEGCGEEIRKGQRRCWQTRKHQRFIFCVWPSRHRGRAGKRHFHEGNMTMHRRDSRDLRKGPSQRTQFVRVRSAATRKRRGVARANSAVAHEKRTCARRELGTSDDNGSTIRLQGGAAPGVGGRVSQRRVRRLGGRCARRVYPFVDARADSPARSPSTSAANTISC